jgi:hypothetical protein
MFNYLLLAFVLVILVLIIYHYSFSNKAIRNRSEGYYNKSNGTFDENAETALNLLNSIDDLSPDDHFRRGSILQHNILNSGLRQENDAEILSAIASEYTDTLNGLYNNNDIQRDFAADFMVNQIEDFRDRAAAYDNIIIDDFNIAVDTFVPAIKQASIDERKQKAAESAESRADATNQYLKESINFTDDRQNVHDTKVNIDLRKTLSRIKSTSNGMGSMAAINDAIEYIEEFSDDPDNLTKAKDALKILDIVKRGNYISTFNDTEDRIFAYTWERCSHRNNSDVSNLMKDAVINSLADSMENGSPVCINGRCSRVINSLVTLDYDKNVSQGALTYEALKNQIFGEVQQIINSNIKLAVNSSDDKLKDVGRSYEGANVETDSETEAKFKDSIKKEIDEHIDGYISEIDIDRIEQLKHECYSALY